MKVVRIASIAFACAIALPAIAAAQPNYPPAGGAPQGPPPGAQGQRGPGRMQAMLFQGIELTDDQKAQIQKVGESLQTERRAMMESIGPMQPGTPPESATRAKMEDFQKKQVAEYRKVLTADQQKTFDANVEEMRKRMEQMRRN
jgi:Spy/CpxP family protein refolding chaperone